MLRASTHRPARPTPSIGASATTPSATRPFDAMRRSGWFDLQMDRLAAGDYLVNGEALVERKTIRDFTTSLLDGRLFPQVARLAHSPYRSLLLIEGPTPSSLPDVHHHSVDGALVSIATMWRIPVLHSSDPEQPARMLRFLAEPVRGPHERVLRRFEPKPKRLASWRLFLLQGLPGVGPALADRLLTRFGSIERIRRMPPHWPKCPAAAGRTP